MSPPQEQVAHLDGDLPTVRAAVRPTMRLAVRPTGRGRPRLEALGFVFRPMPLLAQAAAVVSHAATRAAHSNSQS
jgi:hypothetical protein